MDEFALIRKYFSALTAAREGVVLGVGDDAALLQVPPGEELVLTTDTLISGRHFPESTHPADVGWKSLAVNLSDLAAMGARPRWFTLALTLPEAQPRWLEHFAAGLKALADEANVALIGGDTTRGHLSITVAAMGTLPRGSALRRSGAKAGDAICVTGTLGDAALALERLRSGRRKPGDADDDALQTRLNRPAPRLAAGCALRELAHAAIDLSDGLAGDLAHILEASGVGAEVRADALPMSPAFEKLAPRDARLALQAAGGDDYELCVCLPPARIAEAKARLDVPLAEIGRITAEPGLRFVDSAGAKIAPPLHGYRHFG